MSPISLAPVLPVIGLALLTVYLINRAVPIPREKGHNIPIDGLRGYLAFFVFLHHSCIWYFFLRYQRWNFPPSRLYAHFGPTSVALFFMITAYLFFSKLLDARGRAIDWVKLYVGRICRILPLYLVVLAVLFVVVGILSGFRLHRPLSQLIGTGALWLLFVGQDINGEPLTQLIVAVVVWSLAYEWLFYFSLAFLGWMFCKIKVPVMVLVFTAMGVFIFIQLIAAFYPDLGWPRITPFFGGIVAAFAARHMVIKRWAIRQEASILILLLMTIAVVFFSTVYEPMSLVCMSLAFIGIAAGNDFFGILTHRTSRCLGQISYSIYLVHGFLLFLTFRFIIGFPRSARLSPLTHWAVIAICGIVLVIVCTFTYLLIERPGIWLALPLSRWIKNIFQDPDSKPHATPAVKVPL